MNTPPEERFRGLGAFDDHQSVPTPAPERPDRLREANERLVSAAQAIVTGWYGDGFDDYQVDELRAALAAAPVTDAGLDVERLARAMREDALTIASSVDDYPVGDLDDYRPEAQRLAAEYAALSRQAEKETA
jgi:hypothetical protein